MFSLIKELLSLTFSCLIVLLIIFITLYILIWMLIIIKLKPKNRDQTVISFIHPFCSDFGGGEKVLWRMIEAMLKYNKNPPKNKKIKLNIISAIKEDSEEVRNKLFSRFGMRLDIESRFVREIEIIRLKSGYMLKPQSHFTLILQILGQIIFSYEILTTQYSDYYIETTGLPFSYLLLKLFGNKVAAYVHYPLVSPDMKNDVLRNIEGVHSRGRLNKNPLFKKLKLQYYDLITVLYRICGKCLTYALTNSSWTNNHMIKIWKNTPIQILYPPCSLHEECSKNRNRQNIIVSFAQFRPEKKHELQISIMMTLKQMGISNVQLHMIGGVRNAQDQKYFDSLREKIINNGLEDYIQMIPNASLEQIKNEFSIAKIGIHTMKDEHFGISIIEMMSAGLIVIAHNSAGAKNDIIAPSPVPAGIVVDNESDYASHIVEILNSYERLGYMCQNAVERAKMFSDEEFVKQCHVWYDKIFVNVL